jgi:ATP-dependent DNA helicase RecQ
MNGRYGATTVAEVLRGADIKRIINAGLHRIKSYGIMPEKSVKEIREIIDFLIRRGYMMTTEGQYPVVKICEKANAVLFEGEKVLLPLLEEESDKKPAKKSAPRAAVNSELFAALKTLRSKFAEAERVPAFIIFSDASLIDMQARRPSNEREFLQVSGAGQKKLDKYGKAFMEVINGFSNDAEYK